MKHRNRSLLDKMHRLARFRLLVPLQRSPHTPEYTARGVAIGIWWAFTPLVGVQMPCTFLTWLGLRWRSRTNFNLVVALAWNWVTNVFTMVPIYYIFYLTGQVMLGRWDDLSGYGSFSILLNEIFGPSTDMMDSLVRSAKMAAKGQGLALAVGCLPWAFGLSRLSYVWSLRYLDMRRAARLRRFREPKKPPPAQGGDS